MFKVLPVFKLSVLEGKEGEHGACISGLLEMRWDTP